jgi:transposase
MHTSGTRFFSSVTEKGRIGRAVRVSHDREAFRGYLEQLPAGSPIAVESSGHWYWLVDEIERAGHEPHLVNAGEAKRRMGKPNKTDKLDAEGLAILLRNGTLPEVWIPPIVLRDQRELLRLRMFLVALRTEIKNRIHGALGRYNIQIGVTDLFGIEGRQKLEQRMGELLIETRESVKQQLITHEFPGAASRAGRETIANDDGRCSRRRPAEDPAHSGTYSQCCPCARNWRRLAFGGAFSKLCRFGAARELQRR